jgi:hypothetical protein
VGPIGEGISGRGRGGSDPLLVDCSGAERHADQEVVGEVEDGTEECLRRGARPRIRQRRPASTGRRQKFLVGAVCLALLVLDDVAIKCCPLLSVYS